ncbi:MAG: hypothetical protein Q4A79_00325 [Candidatus Saccharibacteria bacterium]|nr:hypothetical protein [Candidatus Saccharibacteria bacterium]
MIKIRRALLSNPYKWAVVNFGSLKCKFNQMNLNAFGKLKMRIAPHESHSKTVRSGFTLVEVMLFLAISGLLFVSILVGTQASIGQQRMRDSVQNFAEFLRSVYAEASNPENVESGGGRSSKVIYGKMISFGQDKEVNGAAIPSGTQKVFVYNVIGDQLDGEAGSITELLEKANANIVVSDSGVGATTGKMRFVGEVASYTPRWKAKIETTGGNEYKGEILVVRHPSSGEITTLASTGNAVSTNFNSEVWQKNGSAGITTISKLLNNTLNNSSNEEVNFCLKLDELGAEKVRRNIRIIKNAHNASGVEIVEGEGKC